MTKSLIWIRNQTMLLSNYVVPYTNSFWINQVQTWIKAKYGDVGRFVYILELLEKDEPLYQSDQTYLFEKLEKYRFQQQFSHISSINKKVQSVQQLQLEYSFISEQIQIKQTELDEITSKTKSMQQLPTENYLISEQIQIKQTELDEITSKTKSMQQKQAKYDRFIEQIQIKQTELDEITSKTKSMQQKQAKYDRFIEQIQIKQTELDEITSKTKSMQQKQAEYDRFIEQIQIKQTELDEITSKTKSMQQKQAEYDRFIEQIQIKQDKLQTLNKQTHIKTSNLEKKIHEKNILLRSLREQCNKYEQQKNEAFLFVSKIRNDVEMLQSKKTILDEKINTIKKALKIFDISDNVR